MKRLMGLFALVLVGSLACERSTADMARSTQKEGTMTAQGTFDVKVTPQPADSDAGPIGRLLLDKQFHGALEATSKGQMLGAQFVPNSGTDELKGITGRMTIIINGKEHRYELVYSLGSA